MYYLLILSIQCICSMVVFYILMNGYIQLKLAKGSTYKILAFLLVINVFRYLPLSLFMPGQVSEFFPAYLKGIVAYGDFVSALLAFVALWMVKKNHGKAIKAIWVFLIISILDIIIVLFYALKAKVYLLDLGANYFTISVYVPLIIVAQFFIIKIITIKNLKHEQ